MPVRDESRCICGHRLKAHAKIEPGSAGPPRCLHPGCRCKGFFFILAEGSWILRCRCKHRHTDHDPVTHACTKPGCGCGRFDSPFVCNCDHPWSSHRQVLVTKTVLVPRVVAAGSEGGADRCLACAPTSSLADLDLMAGAEDMRGWEQVKRGADAPP